MKQHQQAPYYHPAAAQVNASFGAATHQQGGGGYEAEFGGGGGKATRRKGRDMERALARGDLGALGTEVRARSLSQVTFFALLFPLSPTLFSMQVATAVSEV